MSTRLKTHVALNATDLDRSIAFYRAFFGSEPAKVRPGYAKFELADPLLNFTLNQASEGERASFRAAGGVNHLGIQVASTAEVDKAASRLRASGLLELEERDTDCCYALQDKVWAQDPDGHRWEIFVVKQADTGTSVGEEPSASTKECCDDGCCAAEPAA